MTWDMDIWESRYKQHKDRSPDDTIARVASCMAMEVWGKSLRDFISVMERGEFIPGGRILANAGKPNGMLLNCFNVPVRDSRYDIFTALSEGIEVLAQGGGVGFNFSNLRPAGSPLKSTGGTSQGPIPFIDLFDHSFQLISHSYQHRQAAAIAVLSRKHPDVKEFIRAKRENGVNGGKRWPTMNVSVDFGFGADGKDGFEGPEVEELLELVADSVWECGDPGILFLDRARWLNNVEDEYAPITGVNPCGEVPLYDYGACCLGSINLSALVSGGRIDADRLRFVSRTGVDFLSSVLYQTAYPGEKFKVTSLKYRRIGLGVTGLAHALIKCGLVYGSPESRAWTNEVFYHICKTTYERSEELAAITSLHIPHQKTNGGFVINFGRGLPLFNSGLMAVAPTGSTSMLLKTSSGIEPIFAVDSERSDRGVVRAVKDPLWGQYPEHLFVTALDVSPEDQLTMLDTIQRQVDGSVSKTINLPESTTKKDVRDFLFRVAHSNVKGLTLYRNRSLGVQVVDLDQKIQEGTFYAVSTPSGTVHIPVSRDARGNIKQVYVLLDKPGGEEFALASALGRVISIGLQEGTPVERIIDTLTGIGAGQVKWTTIRGKRTPILSAPDAVAKVLADAVRQTVSAEAVNNGDSCPECRMPLTRAEGCVSCGCGSYCETHK